MREDQGQVHTMNPTLTKPKKVQRAFPPGKKELVGGRIVGDVSVGNALFVFLCDTFHGSHLPHLLSTMVSTYVYA
jgi:hypothetical protein